MGWDYYAESEAALLAEITKGWRDEGTGRGATCLASARVDEAHTGIDPTRILWSAWQVDGEDGRYRTVVCHLIGTTTYHGRVLWGHKDMGEESGPFFYSCPLNLLDLTEPGPIAGPAARQWRTAMRAGESYRLRRDRHTALCREAEQARAAARRA